MNVIEYKINVDRKDILAGDLYNLDGSVPEKYKALVEGKEPYEVVQTIFGGSEIEMKFTSEESLSCGHRFEFENHECIVMACDMGVYFAKGFSKSNTEVEHASRPNQ